MSVEIPDYDYARGRTNAAAISIFLGLASITVALRIYVRAFITRNLELDDLFLVSSQVVTNVGAGICAYIDAARANTVHPPKSSGTHMARLVLSR